MKAVATPLAHRRLETIAVAATVLLLVVGRGLVFLFEHVQFDADQAITGLMAKHIAELRAFPFYAYAANYVFTIESWLAAPFIALLGTSVAALRIPLILVNVTAGALLVWLLVRELHLRPLIAIVPALFFVIAPPTLAAELLTAVGGNSEPFVYVLLLWVFRDRPIIFGTIFIVGFLNREFTAYALSALIAIDVLRGHVWQREYHQQKAIALIVIAAGWELTRVLRMYGDARGPGTALGIQEAATSNVAVATGFLCQDLHWSRVVENLTSLTTTQLSTMIGATPFRLDTVNIHGWTSQGVALLWPMFCVAMLGALGRLGWLAVQAWRSPRTGSPVPAQGVWFTIYLGLIGFQSGVVWAISRCDALSPLTLRYGLLLILVPIAIAALYVAIEPRALGRRLMIAFIIFWAAASARSHVTLLASSLIGEPPANEYRQLTNELTARGIRYVWSDYWTAYMIDFLTDEQIIATSTGYMRVQEYEDAVVRHASESVVVSREPCEHGERIRRWYLCKR